MNNYRPLMLRIMVLVLLTFALCASVGADVAQPPTPLPPLQTEARRLASAANLQHKVAQLPAAPNSVSVNAVADAELMQGYPSAGCGSQLGMRVGYDDYLEPDGQIVRGLVKFNLASIPSGATINSAQLQLYQIGSWDYPGQSRTITTYRVTANWFEDIVNWNTAPGFAEAYGSATVPESVWAWYPFDVTNLVRGWQNGMWPNYGILLRGPEHSGADSSWREFATSETAYPPRLVINYTVVSDVSGGVEPHSFTISSIGALESADYVLSATPVSRSVNRGDNISFTLSVSPTEGYTGTVALSVSGLPSQATSGWTANPVSLSGSQRLSSTLLISTSAGTPAGNYTLFVTGTADSLTHAVSMTLTVRQQVYLPVVLKDYEYFTSLFLIIGISDYQNMSLPAAGVRAGVPGYDLIQPIRDSTDMGDVVSTRGSTAKLGAISSRNSLVLNDLRATKAAIRNAIVNWLASHASPDTTVVIFFSGHGSHKLDETTRVYHEYIAPYDLQCDPCGPTPETTVWRLETAIRDDELAGWLNQVPSQRMVLVFDSCFSGGMVDAMSLSRGLATSSNDFQSTQAGAGMLSRLSAPGRLALMASAADQGSWEFAALKNGVFTYYLIQGLVSPSADTNDNGTVSFEEAFTYAQGRVDSYVYNHTGSVVGGPYHQNPQISDGIPGEVDLTVPMSVTACP